MFHVENINFIITIAMSSNLLFVNRIYTIFYNILQNQSQGRRHCRIETLSRIAGIGTVMGFDNHHRGCLSKRGSGDCLVYINHKIYFYFSFLYNILYIYKHVQIFYTLTITFVILTI